MAFFGVRFKIFLSLLATTVLFGLGMAVFAETVIYNKLHSLLKEKGVALARRAAADCVNPVITENYFEMTMMLKDMMVSDKDVVYAFVLSDDGRVLAHSFSEGVPSELKTANRVGLAQPYSGVDLATDKGKIHDIAIPLLGGQIGVFRLGLSDTAIHNDINDIVASVVLFSVFMLIAGTAASMTFSRNITRPLTRLAAAAEAFGRGELEHDVPIKSHDEISALTKTFNSMVEGRRQIESEREQLIAELQRALSEVKTLRGFLPVCAWCKKIRDDSGSWQQMETYIKEHSDAEFSHGICPECAKKQYSDLQKVRQKKEA